MEPKKLTKKYVLIIFLIILLLILSQLGAIIEFIKTGKVLEVIAASNVTVKEPLDIFNITVENLQNRVNPGQNIYSNITVKNEIYEGTVKIEWSVEDNLGNVLDSSFTTIYMTYGYTWNSIKSLFIPSNTSEGTYWFKVITSAPGYYSSGNDSFEVFLPSVSLPPQPGVPSLPSLPKEFKKEIEIYFPTKVITLVNTTKEFYINVKNVGEVNISNILVILEGLELSWFSIFPNNITLKPNETQSFTVKLTIPADAFKKDYPTIITLVSKEIVTSFQITISVKRIFNYSELQEKLESLKKEIEILENESKTLEEKNIDIREIKKLLIIIKEKLSNIEKEILAENPERASELVYETEELVDISKTVIKNKKPAEITFWVFSPIYIVLIILLIVILTLSIMFFKSRKKAQPTYTISEIIEKIEPNTYVTLHAELRPHAYGIPNIYSLEDNTGIIYANSPKLIEAGIYTIEGMVKEEKRKKYIEIRKVKKMKD